MNGEKKIIPSAPTGEEMKDKTAKKTDTATAGQEAHSGKGCSCGHDHKHEHGENCSCKHNHKHEHGENCSCGHDHKHEHAEGKPKCPCGHDALTEGVGHDRSMGRIFFALFGGVLIVNSYLLEYYFPGQKFAAMFSAMAGAFILALPIVITAIKDLATGKVYMNELVALAILAALAGGSSETGGSNFQTAGIIAFFLLLTIIIETRTASGAQRSIEELIKLTPSEAHFIAPDGTESKVDVSTLKLGDRIRVLPGENFPVDGRILAGETAVNQASITGESLPVDKFPGDDVFAGTANESGMVELEVTKLGSDTTLGKVKEMILAAENSRTPVVRIIDRYANFYTPTVLMLAAITFFFTRSMDRVIALMVIACPCAIVLSTPTAVVAAVAAAARLGILIKNISHLELAAKVKAFVFDKTGTLTDGILSVVKLQPFGDITPAQLLKAAFSVERFSNHPTAQALVRLAAEAGLSPDEVSDFKEYHGRGVSGTINGKSYRIGRLSYLKDQGLTDFSQYNEKDAEGMSVIFVSCDGKLLGWIGLQDKMRENAAEMIEALRKQNVRFIAMVTGDRESAAHRVASKLALDDYSSESLPEGKVAYVQKVKKNSLVAVVGDGVNDAPALAAGDLGVAMGAIGSDVAINSASVALMTNDLRRIPMLLILSRQSRSIINQNLLFGLCFVIIGILLSVFGWMTPIRAAILHTASTLIVIFNSARLMRTGEELTMKSSARQNG